MRIKIALSYFLSLWLVPGALAAAPAGGSDWLRTACASGKVTLDAAPDYGKDTEWAGVFYNTFVDIAAAPDGTVFAACSRQHKIFRFDAGGRLAGSFGRQGQGPGDLTSPGDLSILDGEFLVIGEKADLRRVSLFRLDGTFAKLLATKSVAFRVVALRDGKIAYSSRHSQMSPRSVLETTERVFIKDCGTGTEVQVAEFRDEQRMIDNKTLALKFNQGVAHIARTPGGDLLVGSCFEPLLRVYSPDGRKVGDLALDMTPSPVTRAFLKGFRESRIREWKDDPRINEAGLKMRIDNLDKVLYEGTLDQPLPLYRAFYTDPGGHLMFFLTPRDFEGSGPAIKACEPDGKPIGEFRLEPGRWGIEVDPTKRHFAFTAGGLYVLVENKDAADYELRIIRVDPPGRAD